MYKGHVACWFFTAVCLLLLVGVAFGQNIQPYVSDMNKALGERGSVTLSDGHVLIFRFVVPGPMFAFPSDDTGDPKTTKWTIMTLDFVSLTADLKSLNEDKINEWLVFSPAYISTYKSGDTGDVTMVEFTTIGDALMPRTTIDRDKLAKLGPGQVTGDQLGEKTIADKHAFIAFSDRTAARAFEKALRVAIVIAKAQ